MPSKKKSNTKVPPKDAVNGWHFLPEDMKLEYSDGRTAEIGKTLSISKNASPRVCSIGMHASEKIVEAAVFRKGPVLCRVKVWGDVSYGGNKFAGRHRYVVWAKKLTAKDIKECLKHVGYSHSSHLLNDLIDDLGHASNSWSYKDEIEKWLQEWAKKNEGSSIVRLEYVKKSLDKKIVKGFIAQRLVRTEKEIAADMGDVYDVNGDLGGDTLNDILYSLVYDGVVCEVGDYTESGAIGYVLKLKRKR